MIAAVAYDDLDETVRNLRILADSPGDLRYRQQVANSLEVVSGRLNKIDVKLARIEERQIPRVDIALIAQKEMEALNAKVETLSRIVWGLCGAFGTALIVLAVSKVFGK